MTTPYTYDTGKKNAVVQVENTSNLIQGAASLTYNAFNKVATVVQGTNTLTITYGPDHQRTKTVLVNGSNTTTTLYADNYEQRTVNGTTTTYHYVASPDGLAAVYVKKNGTTTPYYVETDHLGSIINLFDASGTKQFSATYDAWGKQTITKNAIGLTRGYTGHEHWPQFGLIDMNGRFYDPLLGRFLSPDPYVQAPANPQNYNRYSYCLNNPLKYTDPSGEYFWVLPNVGWSEDGGFNFGVSVAVGIPGEYSVQLGVNYSCKANDFSVFVSATANFNTVYAGYSTQSGWNAGYTAGLSIYSGFPINTNFTTAGYNYNFSNDCFSSNISAWQFDQYGNSSFNPSFSAVIFPESTTNLVRGQGFRSNDAVLQRFVNAGEQQAALDYFGFEGTYLNEDGESSFSHKRGILYRNQSFDSYSLLYASYIKESYHQKTYLNGSQKLGNSGVFSIDRWPEEREGVIKLYKTQGLHRNKTDYYQIIKYTEGQINVCNLEGDYSPAYNYTPYMQKWYHFIYKIPRLW